MARSIMYLGKDFKKLVAVLSLEEITCLGECYCCSQDGDCKLQEKAETIVESDK